MKELINKQIKELYISEDKRFLCFKTEDEELVYEAEGDCCSESWFNHICGVYYINSKWAGRKSFTKVHSIEQSPSFNTFPNTKQDVDLVCFTKITLETGYLDIELRNSSNGYYNGSIQFWKDKKMSDIKKATWVLLKEDF